MWTSPLRSGIDSDRWPGPRPLQADPTSHTSQKESCSWCNREIQIRQPVRRPWWRQ
jgi:hypothetical protein